MKCEICHKEESNHKLILYNGTMDICEACKRIADIMNPVTGYKTVEVKQC